jgi:TetR/AcrR family transcriptional regulator
MYSETEEKVFQAALEVFALRGKEGARMQEIADRAGINKALVHYYFRSKDKLYEAAFDYILQKYFAMLSAAIEEKDDFASLLKTFIDKYFAMVESNPVIFPFLAAELVSGGVLFKEKFKNAANALGTSPPAIIIRKFRAAVRKNEIRNLDPVQTFITLIGSIAFFYIGMPMFSILNPDIEINREKFIRQRKQHIYDILYYGLKPRGEQ